MHAYIAIRFISICTSTVIAPKFGIHDRKQICFVAHWVLAGLDLVGMSVAYSIWAKSVERSIKSYLNFNP